jgi:DNA polymerase III subunit epsilon
MIGFFDTETNGFPNPNLLPDDPKQGRIVQLGILVTDLDGNIAHELRLILNCEGIYIPSFVSDIHGITNEVAQRFGVDRQLALRTAADLLCRCDVVIAHNIEFDDKMLNIESAIHEFNWTPKRRFCSMKESTAFVDAKKANGQIKWPKLQELHVKLFGEQFDEAHDAMADVRATAKCIFELRKRNIITL